MHKKKVSQQDLKQDTPTIFAKQSMTDKIIGTLVIRVPGLGTF